MIDYKDYIVYQLGLREDVRIPKGIDSNELEMGAEEEAGEHNMNKDTALKTAIQHLKEPGQQHYYSGLEKAKEKGELKDNIAISPTAIKTPVIGVAVRGSSTGGLPSGKDQSNDISPSNLGGYQKVNNQSLNSQVIDKTPCNSTINSSSPKATTISTDNNEVHPHQIQNDGDTSNEVDVNLKSLDNIFEKHKQLALQKIKENAGNDPSWKMDSEKAGMVKCAEEKWIQKAIKPSTKGSLHKDLGIPTDQKISTDRLNSIKSRLHKKTVDKQKLTDKEQKLLHRVNAALNMRKHA